MKIFTTRTNVASLSRWALYPLLLVLPVGILPAESYYKETPQFHMWPDPGAARYKIERFGPVGIGLELRQPAFTMHIVNVEAGSPAEACGKLKEGQIIESINGKVLKDEDPRVLLGNWITEVEAKDGVMKMMVKDSPDAAAQEVIVRIPALGAYSGTWPVSCGKSDKIVRAHADALARNIDSADIGLNGALLFLLSTGEEKDLEVARQWVAKLVEKHKDKEEMDTYPWFAGYTGPGFCEYYLRTGDKSILPIIRMMSDSLAKTIYNGSWMGRGGASYGYMGGGHLNAAGLHAVTFLLLAKECGVEVDEHTLQSSLYHIYRFAGHGNIAYGDHLPEGGFAGNGKTEGLTFTMQAAANLHPDGEKSVYAKARDISGTKAFYSTSWLFHGHTGGGIGELWRGPAMGVVRDDRPAEYQSFMDERRWMYELARTHDGVFGWVSDWNVGYTDTGIKGRGWGSFIPLVYTLPRQHLRIYGAPPSKYSHTHRIPDRPWGNEADEIFLSMVPGEYLPGKRQDISKERLPTDASAPILARIDDPGVTDEVLLMYGHHFDEGIRTATARAINNHGRPHLVLALLKSEDRRARLTGITCINGMSKGKSLPDDQLTDEMFELIGAMIDDPDEAWWVLMGAMESMGRAKPDQIAPHFERMLAWIDHEDWWLRQAAMKGLTPVAGDKRLHKPFLTKVGKLVQTSQRMGDFSPLGGIVGQLQEVDPEIRKFAMEVLGESYVNYPTELTEPGGQELSANIELLLDNVARNLATVPGGYDEVYEIARKRNPDKALPHQDLFLGADSEQFGPKLKEAIQPIIRDHLIPAYVETNRKALENELVSRQPGRAIEGLVDLYKKAGNGEYDWKLYGPARTEIQWSYQSFDPEDGKLWENGWRYRAVEWPKGMENWFSPEFDPKAAGWKVGTAPFGSTGGKLEFAGRCHAADHFCACGTPLKTLWEKEVLMMRAELELPTIKEGHAYRILVSGRSHVNAGDGSDIWIDGKRLEGHRKSDPSLTGVGKRQGGKPWARVIPAEIRSEFADGKIILSATGFMNFAGGKKANRQSFWLEEMKLPEIEE